MAASNKIPTPHSCALYSIVSIKASLYSCPTGCGASCANGLITVSDLIKAGDPRAQASPESLSATMALMVDIINGTLPDERVLVFVQFTPVKAGPIATQIQSA